MPTSTRRRRVSPEDFEDETKTPWESDSDDDGGSRRKGRKRPETEDTADEETGEEESDEEETIIPVSHGRKKINESRPQTEGSSLYFRWADEGEEQIVRFLDVEPWAYNQHWVTRTGKQSFPCLGNDCPLCDIGVKVSQKIVYTLLNLSKDEPTVQALEVSPTLDDLLQGYHDNKKTGPLDRLYWSLSRTKAEKSSSYVKYNYSFLPVKERDLEEDWDIDPDAAIRAYEDSEAPDSSTVLGKVSRRTIQEIADEAMGQ